MNTDELWGVDFSDRIPDTTRVTRVPISALIDSIEFLSRNYLKGYIRLRIESTSENEIELSVPHLGFFIREMIKNQDPTEVTEVVISVSNDFVLELIFDKSIPRLKNTFDFAMAISRSGFDVYTSENRIICKAHIIKKNVLALYNTLAESLRSELVNIFFY